MGDEQAILEALQDIGAQPPLYEAAEDALMWLGYEPRMVAAQYRDQRIVRPPPWLVGFSKVFRKDIDAVDRKARDRVFSAILDLAGRDLNVHGDTVKPLSGAQFEGCWRMRFGDQRLVFRADADRAELTMLCYASRGAVYKD
jgi:mRNA-degrading endonuclease RelE of RelBE toxin-antitoxin system